MIVRLGNVAAKQGRREEVSAADHTRAELEELALATGVVFDDDLDAEALAARLSAVIIYEPIPGEPETTVVLPDGITLTEALVTITAPNGVWSHHSDAPPAWVESDSPGLAMVLAEHFGCSVGRPGGEE